MINVWRWCNNHTRTGSTNCLQKFPESREENLALYANTRATVAGLGRGKDDITDLDIVHYLNKKHWQCSINTENLATANKLFLKKKSLTAITFGNKMHYCYLSSLNRLKENPCLLLSLKVYCTSSYKKRTVLLQNIVVMAQVLYQF